MLYFVRPTETVHNRICNFSVSKIYFKALFSAFIKLSNIVVSVRTVLKFVYVSNQEKMSKLRKYHLGPAAKMTQSANLFCALESGFMLTLR